MTPPGILEPPSVRPRGKKQKRMYTDRMHACYVRGRSEHRNRPGMHACFKMAEQLFLTLREPSAENADDNIKSDDIENPPVGIVNCSGRVGVHDILKNDIVIER